MKKPHHRNNKGREITARVNQWFYSTHGFVLVLMYVMWRDVDINLQLYTCHTPPSVK